MDLHQTNYMFFSMKIRFFTICLRMFWGKISLKLFFLLILGVNSIFRGTQRESALSDLLRLIFFRLQGTHPVILSTPNTRIYL